MIRNIKTIEELNLFYARILRELALKENSFNVKDEALMLMLKNLMQDYNINKNLIDIETKFEKDLVLKNQKSEQKQLTSKNNIKRKLKKAIFTEQKRKALKQLSEYKKQLAAARKTGEKEPTLPVLFPPPEPAQIKQSTAAAPGTAEQVQQAAMIALDVAEQIKQAAAAALNAAELTKQTAATPEQKQNKEGEGNEKKF